MNKWKSYYPVIVALLSFIFILLFYYKIVLHPNQYLFSESGDAIKNYFTYSAQIKGNSYTTLNLMNYPYGENFLYLDCHPAFTVILKLLSHPFPQIENYSIGIINFLMIFSIVLSSVFIYLILIELNVHRFFSVLGAFSIAILAPQIFRASGHLALAYSFFIPLSWYLFIRFSKSPYKLKWSLILFINNLFWYFMHAYLGMMLVAFFLLCFVFEFLFLDRKKYKNLHQWVFVSLQTFFPLMLFWLVVALTDNHVGRTNNPFGFLVSPASFSSIFLPHHGWLRGILERFLTITANWEGRAYIGLGSSICILLYLFNRMYKIFKKKLLFDDKLILTNPHLTIALFSAFSLLLLSMGFPFKVKMEFLLNWIPAIKNFRAIGRFSWVFFYVITISSVYYLNSLCIAQTKKSVYFLLALFLPISFILEGIPYHKEIGGEISTSPNLFDTNQLPDSLSEAMLFARKENYQAIIPLPFYHIGSENYGKTGTNKIYKISMLISYYSGIPIMGNYSTRTSIPESKKLTQLLSPSYYSKEIEKDLRSNKAFLIIYSNEQLLDCEASLLEKCDLIFSNEMYSLYAISKDKLFENTAKIEMQNFINRRDQLTYNHGFLTTSKDSNTVLIFDSFENSPQEISFNGQGSFMGQMKDFSVIKRIEPNELRKNKEYILSFWMYNGGENYGQDALNSKVFLEVKDQADQIEWIGLAHPANSLIINGSWTLVELSFATSDSVSPILVYIKGENYTKKNFYIDDLLIREKDVDVYKIIEENENQVVELFNNNNRIIL